MMSNFIPEMLTLPMKYNVFNLHYQRMQTLIIDKHTQAIQKFCKNNSSPILEKLSSEVFWSTLKESSKKSVEIEELYQIWLTVKPLAHLSSKDLIELYQNHITPLERSYQYLITQFPEKEIAEQLKDNLKSLATLKKHIFEGLRYRAQIHEIMDLPRNVDDVLASIVTEINDLKILPTPLGKPEKLSATLDDDRRLFIFDLLKMNQVDENDLHDEILSSVPKRGHEPLRTKEEVKADLDKFNTYRNKVIKALDLKGAGEYLYAMTTPSNAEGARYLWESAYKKSKQAFITFRMLPFLEKVSRLRFVLYTLLCLSAYSALIPLIQPVALLFVSIKTFSALSTLLFYTIGIAPLWFLGFQAVKQGYSVAYDYLASWKKREILDTLVTLEDTEYFIAERLSKIIIDIPHFDMKALNKQITALEGALDSSKSNLDRYAPGEQWFCKGSVQKEIKKAKEKIESLKTKLNKRLHFLASHIASRVGEDIELLDKTFDKDEMKPILPKKQLEQLAEFVHKVGDKKASALFEHNANIVKKWCNKIRADRFSYNTPETKGNLQQPWGGSTIRTDCLKGWNIILDAFIQDPIQRKAALTLNDCLRGKKALTLDQLHEAVQCLNVGEDENVMIEMFQTFIFKTLQVRSPEYASLLSLKQKEMITQWYHKNKAEIDIAKVQVNRLFSSGKLAITELNALLGKVSNQELSQYFERLDAEDIHSYATSKTDSLKARHNLIRTFFENYQGNTSYAYRLVNFIPEQEKPKLVTKFAYKRLSWLLANVKQSANLNAPFDEYDKVLFHSANLHKESFNFKQCVMDSPHFNEPYSKEMETFLRALPKNGINSEGLLSKYLEKKKTSNTFLPSQKENRQSCREEAKVFCGTTNIGKRGRCV